MGLGCSVINLKNGAETPHSEAALVAENECASNAVENGSERVEVYVRRDEDHVDDEAPFAANGNQAKALGDELTVFAD